MTSLQTTHSDLARVLTSLIAKPVLVKTRRTNTEGTTALKMAWAKYNAWTVDFEKRLGEPAGKFHRSQFAMYLRHAWLEIKIAKRGLQTVSLEDCLHIAGKR